MSNEHEHIYFDVRDYGAVGDGVTDDTAAIHAAIEAAHHAGGGKVQLHKGNVLREAGAGSLLETLRRLIQRRRR